MKKVLKKIWKPVILLLIYALSFFFLLKDCNFKDLGSAFKQMSPIFFALALLMVFAQIYIQGLCYKVMTHSFKMKFNTCFVTFFLTSSSPLRETFDISK